MYKSSRQPWIRLRNQILLKKNKLIYVGEGDNMDFRRLALLSQVIIINKMFHTFTDALYTTTENVL